MRYRLREGLREFTTLPRIRSCGLPIGPSDVAIVGIEGHASFRGLSTCASVHSCPVCSAVIRSRRARELTEGVGQWLADGHGALMVTLTAPHVDGERLADLWKGIAASWSYAIGGGSRKALGVGYVRAFEVTRGVNGWHPHLHVLVFTDKPMSGVRLKSFNSLIRSRWTQAVRRKMDREPGDRVGCVVQPVVNNAAMLAYIGKVDPGATVGNELARLDMKTGLRSSRTPMSILADLVATKSRDDLALWVEYEEASKGRQCLTWSVGMRKILGLDATTDDDVAETPEIIGMTTILAIVPRVVYEARRRLGTLAELLERYEHEAADAGEPSRQAGLPPPLSVAS